MAPQKTFNERNNLFGNELINVGGLTQIVSSGDLFFTMDQYQKEIVGSVRHNASNTSPDLRLSQIEIETVSLNADEFMAEGLDRYYKAYMNDMIEGGAALYNLFGYATMKFFAFDSKLTGQEITRILNSEGDNFEKLLLTEYLLWSDIAATVYRLTKQENLEENKNALVQIFSALHELHLRKYILASENPFFDIDSVAKYKELAAIWMTMSMDAKGYIL